MYPAFLFHVPFHLAGSSVGGGGGGGGADEAQNRYRNEPSNMAGECRGHLFKWRGSVIIMTDVVVVTIESW